MIIMELERQNLIFEFIVRPPFGQEPCLRVWLLLYKENPPVIKTSGLAVEAIQLRGQVRRFHRG